MNFIEAIKTIKSNENLRIGREENAKVNYSSWSKNLYVENSKRWTFHYAPTVDDILAEDWYVVKGEKLHTFEEAITAYKSGKTIKRASCYNKHNPSEKQLIVTTASLLANDWIILNKEETQ